MRAPARKRHLTPCRRGYVRRRNRPRVALRLKLCPSSFGSVLIVLQQSSAEHFIVSSLDRSSALGQGRSDSFASTLKVERSAVGSGSGRPELARPMSQLGRFSRFDGDPANGRNRRVSPVAAPQPALSLVGGNRSSCPTAAVPDGGRDRLSGWEADIMLSSNGRG